MKTVARRKTASPTPADVRTLARILGMTKCLASAGERNAALGSATGNSVVSIMSGGWVMSVPLAELIAP
jgi:hypothetical protein